MLEWTSSLLQYLPPPHQHKASIHTDVTKWICVVQSSIMNVITFTTTATTENFFLANQTLSILAAVGKV